jgi:hypothetical protein
MVLQSRLGCCDGSVAAVLTAVSLKWLDRCKVQAENIHEIDLFESCAAAHDSLNAAVCAGN